ncbi:MAG TPA: AI-2E family transporter [Melioribacteraceae bacterium]|nr:AI-2E family transporter [Melioribacteraceae bacterium]
MNKHSADPTIKFFVSVLGTIALLFTLKELQSIFLPFVIAYFLFFLFTPLNNFLSKKNFPLSLSVIINIIILLSIFFLLGQFIVTSFSQFGEQIPYYTVKLNNIVINFAVDSGIKNPVFLNFDINKYLAKLDYSVFASGLFSSTIDFVSNIFLILFFFIFINSGHDKIINALKNRFEPDNNSEYDANDGLVYNTVKNITDQVQKYISTKALISLLTAIVVSIVLMLFGVDFILVWAAFTFFLNFIPNIGSIISVLLPTTMCLIQYETIGYAVFLLIILMLVQNLIGNILEPKIFGNKLGLNPIIILLSLLLWGYIWGIGGMILSVPITAVLKIIFDRSNSKNLHLISGIMSN